MRWPCVAPPASVLMNSTFETRGAEGSSRPFMRAAPARVFRPRRCRRRDAAFNFRAAPGGLRRAPPRGRRMDMPRGPAGRVRSRPPPTPPGPSRRPTRPAGDLRRHRAGRGLAVPLDACARGFAGWQLRRGPGSRGGEMLAPRADVGGVGVLLISYVPFSFSWRGSVALPCDGSRAPCRLAPMSEPPRRNRAWPASSRRSEPLRRFRSFISRAHDKCRSTPGVPT